MSRISLAILRTQEKFHVEKNRLFDHRRFCASKKKRDLAPDDRSIPGTYAAYVPKDLPLALTVSAVLDSFHGQYGIEVLDDFMFYVFHSESGLVLTEPDDSESYSQIDRIEIEKIGDKLPRIYSIKGDDLLPMDFLVAAENQMEARLSAKKILDDARKGLVINRLY